MTKLEIRRLRALVKSWNREAEKMSRQNSKDFLKAGIDIEDGGSGDEGWMEVHQNFGRVDELSSCAYELAILLRKLIK